MKASRLSENVPSPLIDEEQRTATTNDQKVLQSAVVEVRKQRARRIIEYGDSGLFRYIFKGPVAAIAIEPIGQSRRLADVEIIKSIVVIITGSHTVVAVHVDTPSSIQDCSPVVGPAKHLALIGLGSAQSLRCHIEKCSSAAQRSVSLRLPPSIRTFHCIRFVARPFHLPGPHPFFTPGILSDTDDVVADLQLNRQRGTAAISSIR